MNVINEKLKLPHIGILTRDVIVSWTENWYFGLDLNIETSFLKYVEELVARSWCLVWNFCQTTYKLHRKLLAPASNVFDLERFAQGRKNREERSCKKVEGYS